VSHAWESLVVGGVESPRFLCCEGDQYILNGDFEVDTTGWSAGTKTADSLTPFGDYVLYIAAAATPQVTCSVGTTLAKRSFVVTFWARGAGATETIEIDSEDLTFTGIESGEYKQFAIKKTFPSYRMSTSFTVKFKPSADLYIDRVRVYEVLYDINPMRAPNEEKYTYARELQSKTIMLDGEIKEYVLGWRFMGLMTYGLLEAEDEINRSRISEAAVLVLWPHTDATFVVTCRFSADRYIRNYFMKRFLGHAGPLPLVGVDLLDKKTQEIVGLEIS